ncbi:hypothetical protein C9374_013924 [Naegleria lovaniensis]|uniref:Protein kinase domain-containing protein n=1 Tax=Naegleria lovaniensis TaxID=51637 RepID=A0AA88KPP8_NAELO|nr:uncharacterized protein C9374_013924 [Naegleria lovaniensis]KAG2389364.1 hypothetical protein C9374_013924 [Naegleria lovaniensis]
MKRKLELAVGDDSLSLFDVLNEVREEGYLSGKEKVKKIVDYLAKFELAEEHCTEIQYPKWITLQSTKTLLNIFDINPNGMYTFFDNGDVELKDKLYSLFSLYSNNQFKEYMIELPAVQRLLQPFSFSDKQVTDLMSSISTLVTTVLRYPENDLVISSLFNAVIINLFSGLSVSAVSNKKIKILFNEHAEITLTPAFIGQARNIFFLREDKSGEESLWEKSAMDSLTTILMMHSVLSENIQKMQTIKDLKNCSKVMGFVSNRSNCHLFVLEAQYPELDQETFSNNVTPHYFLIKHSRLTEDTFNVNPSAKKQPLRLQKIGLKKQSKSSKSKKICNQKITDVIAKTEDREVYQILHCCVAKKVDNEEDYIYNLLYSEIEHCIHLPRLFTRKDQQGFIQIEQLTSISTIEWNETALMTLVKHISCALKFLHRLNILHRDVKPSNIMFRKNFGTYVLMDFGLSVHFERECVGETHALRNVLTRHFINEDVGTGEFRAPELRQQTCYDEKIDIFSLGQTVVYLTSNLFVDSAEILSEAYVQEAFKELVKRMISLDPKERPSAEMVETIVSNLLLNQTNKSHSKSTSKASDFCTQH